MVRTYLLIFFLSSLVIQKSFAADACSDLAILCITTPNDTRTNSTVLNVASPPVGSPTIVYESRASGSTLTNNANMTGSTVGVSLLNNNSILTNNANISADIGVRVSAARGTATTGGVINNNNGAVIEGTNTGAVYVYVGDSTAEINNSGTIRGIGGAYGIGNEGSLKITNSSTGVISSQGNYAINSYKDRDPNPSLDLTNNGTISASGSGGGYSGTVSSANGNITLINTGNISASGGSLSAVYLDSGTGTITNSGLITASGSSGTMGDTNGIFNYGAITTITNTGTITSTGGKGYGINNQGTITTLNNLQSSLTYTGRLPTNYNIILGNNASTYGTLIVTSPSNYDGATGKTTFGIDSGTVKATRYAGVFSGLTTTYISAQTGAYSGYTWNLSLQSGSTDTWDLLFPTYVEGPSSVDTQTSLQNTAQALQGTYALQNSVLSNSLSYDCTIFGSNGVCVSTGGRNTAVSETNGLDSTSALLIVAYRPHSNYRIGAYVDQNLSVRNAGSTVNLENRAPLVGLFAAWNENIDGTGSEIKISAAYGQKNTTITRQVVGTSEAGSGSSSLNSSGAQISAKYGFRLFENLIVSPYAGMRYTQNNMGGYTEASSSAVTTPLTYSALNTNATTGLAGAVASYRFIPHALLIASAGVETDTNTKYGSLSATGIAGLTPVNFNPNLVKTRVTANLGAYYSITKRQRIGITGIYRQESFRTISTTTALATYEIGL